MVRPVAQHNYTMADDRLCKLYDYLHELSTRLRQSFYFDWSRWCVAVVGGVIVMNLLNEELE